MLMDARRGQRLVDACQNRPSSASKAAAARSKRRRRELPTPACCAVRSDDARQKAVAATKPRRKASLAKALKKPPTASRRRQPNADARRRRGAPLNRAAGDLVGVVDQCFEQRDARLAAGIVVAGLASASMRSRNAASVSAPAWPWCQRATQCSRQRLRAVSSSVAGKLRAPPAKDQLLRRASSKAECPARASGHSAVRAGAAVGGGRRRRRSRVQILVEPRSGLSPAAARTPAPQRCEIWGEFSGGRRVDQRARQVDRPALRPPWPACASAMTSATC